MSPGQAAQLSELLEYLHVRIRDLLNAVKIKADAERVTLEARQWQNLLDLQSAWPAICGRSASRRSEERRNRLVGMPQLFHARIGARRSVRIAPTANSPRLASMRTGEPARMPLALEDRR